MPLAHSFDVALRSFRESLAIFGGYFLYLVLQFN
jgi:hypothetical protein